MHINKDDNNDNDGGRRGLAEGPGALPPGAGGRATRVTSRSMLCCVMLCYIIAYYIILNYIVL